MTPAQRALFVTAYSATNRAADLTQLMAAEEGGITGERSKVLVRQLSDALCAARELDNQLAGNPPPQRGD